MLLSPETRVGALLDAHPEVEEALVAYVPAFGKLKNPLLRKTVAQVATLAQAARAGGVPLPELLAFLRGRLGQESHESHESPGDASAPSHIQADAPAWFREADLVLELDAAALLETGDHPLPRVRQALAQHPAGAIVAVRSAFEPAPLMDLLGAEGMLVWCGRQGEHYRTCVRKP